MSPRRVSRGFTLVDGLTVLAILAVVGALLFVMRYGLLRRVTVCSGEGDCVNNVRNLVGLLDATGAGGYPRLGGPNLILFLVVRGELSGPDDLGILFCSGDFAESLELAGGEAAYRDLDLSRRGRYGRLTSYAGRDFTDDRCTVPRGAAGAVVLVSDDSEDHHDGRGFVVGLAGGAAKWRDKVEDWELPPGTPVEVGESSRIPELRCLRSE